MPLSCSPTAANSFGSIPWAAAASSMIRASGNPCGRCRSDASVRAIESPGGTGCDVALGTGGCADLAAWSTRSAKSACDSPVETRVSSTSQRRSTSTSQPRTSQAEPLDKKAEVGPVS